jgi:hypothetical protein
MADIPCMPTNWWPNFIVSAKSSDSTLDVCFAIVSDEGRRPDIITPNLDGLRKATWQALHDPEFRKKLSV